PLKGFDQIDFYIVRLGQAFSIFIKVYEQIMDAVHHEIPVPGMFCPINEQGVRIKPVQFPEGILISFFYAVPDSFLRILYYIQLMLPTVFPLGTIRYCLLTFYP